jgi:hypothetical protein
VTGYSIYRNGTLLTTIGPATSYDDATVLPGTSYSYQIQARDAAGNVSTMSNTVSVTTPLLLFSDGFESGNLSQWTSVSGLTVQQSHVYAGQYAARSRSTGTATYAYKQLSQTQNKLYYRLWFKIISQGANSVYLQRFRTGSNGAIMGVFISSTGKLAYRNDIAGVTTTSTTVVTQGTWHELQVRVLINGAAGETEVWLDGTRVEALSKIQNLGSTFIGRIQLGESSSGRTYDVALDQIALSTRFIDSSNPPASTSTPTRTPTRTPTATGTVGSPPTNTPTRTATPGSGSTLIFGAVADARVSQASPTTNYGNATTLLVDASAGAAQTSYIRFTTSGISGSIQNIKLRVFCTTNGTANGPAVYLANSSWLESGSGGITWNNQPALLTSASDNKGAFASATWVEYDVTALVTGNGTYTFALVADSNDGVTFSSREGTTPPQLVVTLGGSALLSPVEALSSTDTLTSTPTATLIGPSPANTSTPTNTPESASIVYTYTSQPDGTNGIDTYLQSISGTADFGKDVAIAVGENNNATGRVTRGVIKFDLSAIPSNATIVSATLSLWTANDLSDNDRMLHVYRLKVPFDESQATWTQSAAGINWQGEGASGAEDRESFETGSIQILADEPIGAQKQIPLSAAMIQELVNGSFINNGFVILVDDESNDRFNYKSSDSSNVSNRPMLVIEYTLP